MIEPAAFDLVEIPIDLAHSALELLSALVEHRIAVASQHRHIAIVQVNDFPRVGENRRDIAGDVVLTITQPDQKWAALSGGDDLVPILAGDDGNPVSAFDLPQRLDDGVLEIPVEGLFDEM